MCPNFRDGNLQQGQGMAALSKLVFLTADNTGVSIGVETLVLIGSDNTTATNRTFTVTPSKVGAGHQLRLIFNTAGSTKAQLVDTGAMKLNGDWLPGAVGDSLTLCADASGNWVEVSRSYTGTTSTIALTDAHILVGNGAGVATDVAMSGDATIANTGAVTIAALAVTNAKVAAAAAIDFSKLAVLASGNVIVGSAGGVATSVAMAGDVTIIAAGTTAIGAGKVTKAMIASTVRPAYMVILAGTFTTVGGDANETIPAVGAIATDLAFAEIRTFGTGSRTIVTTAANTDTIDLVMSGDPSNNHVICWQILRATT